MDSTLGTSLCLSTCLCAHSLLPGKLAIFIRTETHVPSPWYGQYRTHAHNHITRAVAAMDSCFALIGAHQHGIAVGSRSGSKPAHRDPLLPRRVHSTPLSWEPQNSSPMAMRQLCHADEPPIRRSCPCSPGDVGWEPQNSSPMAMRQLCHADEPQ